MLLIRNVLFSVSGLSGTTETAQSQVSVGMGLLAGSTVMLLTVIWGSCVIVGKCDIQGSVAMDNKDTKGLSLTGKSIFSLHVYLRNVNCKFYMPCFHLTNIVLFICGQKLFSPMVNGKMHNDD